MIVTTTLGRLLDRRVLVPEVALVAPVALAGARLVGQFRNPLRPISLLTLSLLRLLDSNFPGNPLWAWEFHPLELRLCLSQTS